MTQILGQIVVEQDSDQLLFRSASPDARRQAAVLIRKISPAANLRVDAGGLQFDLGTAVRLRGDREGKRFAWHESAARLVDTLAFNYANIAKARRKLNELANLETAKLALADYPRTTGLDAHQVTAVAAMADPAVRGLCLFDEQGAGKTVVAIHAFDCLVGRGEDCQLLIFAPKNMVEEWAKDFRKFLGDKYLVCTVTGSRAEKYDALHSPGQVYVTNYETAHLLETSLRSLLNRNPGRMIMVVDESFFVKNRETKRAAAVRRLRHLCDRCWVLCGTPAPNNALDVVHQFDVADGGVTFSGVSLPEDPPTLRDAIQRAVEQRGVYLRRLKYEVLPELPRKRFERVSVPMEDQQRTLYGAALAQLVREVERSTDVQFKSNLGSFLGRRMALFELCSHPGQVVDGYDRVPGKLLALDQLLDELISRRGEKVVLWSFFRYSLDRIVARYGRFNPVRIDGSVTDTRARGEAITRFQEDDSTMLFIGNPAAAGAGITLTRSCIAVYESFSVQAAHYLQSLDRIHRRGQTRDVNYYMLLCQDSIEEDEYERLLQKEQAARQLFRDSDPRPLARDVFLAELLAALRKL